MRTRGVIDTKNYRLTLSPLYHGKFTGQWGNAHPSPYLPNIKCPMSRMQCEGSYRLEKVLFAASTQFVKKYAVLEHI